MTRATVEESTAGLRQTLRTGCPLVGGLSFHGVGARIPGTEAAWWNAGPEYVRRVSLALGVGYLLANRTPLGWRSVLGTAKTRLKAHQNKSLARRDQQTRATLWHELFQNVARARARRRPP